MIIVKSGRICISFNTIDVTVNMDNPQCIKITNGNSDEQMGLIFQSDYERRNLIEKLQQMVIEEKYN